MKNDALIEQITGIAKPFADELNYELYHIEYVKESGEYYLRIYIDKEGGITLSDCEAISRRVNDVLDEIDPIKEPYFFEVQSPGLNRPLFTDDHFKKFIGREVMVRFTKSLDGSKNVKGVLKEVNEDNVVVEAETLVTVPKDKIKSANLEGEI